MDERVEQIVEELIDLAQGADEYGLVQFRSRAAAGQYAVLYELFRRHVVPGGAVLDWGSGNGHFSYYLLRTGHRTTSFSVEKRPSVGQLASGQLREVHGDPTEPVALPFSDGEFDAIASVGVLEHVGKYGGDELASLREIRRVLCPGGVLVCTHLPNRHSAIEALARRSGGA
jgi:cyclopropane fatty-acyl-phospholipid synthase-like methyltransferase